MAVCCNKILIMKKALLCLFFAALLCEAKVERFWVRCPTELLDTPIPKGIGGGVWRDGTNEVAKTLREFVYPHLTFDMGDGTTLFRLAHRQNPYGKTGGGWRMHNTNENDMNRWNGFLAPYGYGRSMWLSSEEAWELIDTLNGDTP